MAECHLCAASRPIREFVRLPGRAGDDARYDHCARHDTAEGCRYIDAVTGQLLCGVAAGERGIVCLLDDQHYGDHHGHGHTWPQG